MIRRNEKGEAQIPGEIELDRLGWEFFASLSNGKSSKRALESIFPIKIKKGKTEEFIEFLNGEIDKIIERLLHEQYGEMNMLDTLKNRDSLLSSLFGVFAYNSWQTKDRKDQVFDSRWIRSWVVWEIILNSDKFYDFADFSIKGDDLYEAIVAFQVYANLRDEGVSIEDAASILDRHKAGSPFTKDIFFSRIDAGGSKRKQADLIQKTAFSFYIPEFIEKDELLIFKDRLVESLERKEKSELTFKALKEAETLEIKPEKALKYVDVPTIESLF